ncbi:beta-ketoacyl synthase N-terminal-like domain-containing protein [Peristeroidobacter agariperforans]|uniref:beta-ketoacyl synthase N-terminal-like domain-containing protein n=1 Tax=Peristeroidobacter agariperforans TaxID=268404 RepID=UPI0018E50B65|nr:beta-ketoacyl synthase N-terminal-like domain-containing protein [Peristeroidobacter agariperforans]
MIDNEQLVELTESYLKSLVRTAVGSMSADFASTAPFGELGIDSFRVLKIIKALEADFGRLPKTLLFENFNIADLAQYFVARHEQTLRARLSSQLKQPVQECAPAPEPVVTPKQSAERVKLRPAAQPVLMLESDACTHPELGPVVRNIFEQYKNEGSVSRGTRNIAPNLFIGSERRGFFHYSRSNDIILAYTYTGPRDYFPALAKELYEHCASRKLSVNIVYDEETPSICGIPFTSTPFGALQRVLGLQQFTLDGKAMRRLRYQVSKFEKAGNCRTEEFRCGSNDGVARAIATVIDQWCAARTMVNPLIHIVKDEILAGTLDPKHRIFVTYLDDVLQNAILISPLAAEQNGYLMDLEFYPDSMPLGGLEFTIVKIVERLVAEGCDVLSLGGTYGCKLGDSSVPDAAVEKILDDLRMQNIFNDEGNLQFKNKFRPENKPIYLCRPQGQPNADEVLDIIMMIADPMKMQTSDAENHLGADTAAVVENALIIEGEARSADLLQCGFNPLNLLPQQVEFDLKTDSWAQLRLPAIDNQRRLLSAQLNQRVDLGATLADLFPFAHFALTTSGRTAESVFCSVWPRKGVVLQNLLFPTTLFHQMDNALVPTELPHAEVFRLDSSHLYKGDMDWAALQREVSRDPAAVAYVCIEVSDNAAGGHPVSIEHLKRVKQLVKDASIPLVLDGTRIIENAYFVIENEPGYAGRTLWSVVREILGYADAVLLSFGKNFCVTGGLIAVNDGQLFQQVQDRIRAQGCGLSGVDRKQLALALRRREYIESQTSRRKQSVRRIWDALKEQGIPVVQPAGAHCILIDVKQVPEFRDFKHPVASFLAWLFLNTGIRGGAHNAGMQRNTAINDLVRLAIPVGLSMEQVDSIIERLVELFAQRSNIPELASVQDSADSVGDIHGRYKLVRYHNASGRIVSSIASSPREPIVPAPAEQTVPGSSRDVPTQDIAIVGMAGRYPQANNLQELWQSLVTGKDCIESISDARLALRSPSQGGEKYRGGFIADVDKFDARFFNISAREAQVLDPQERLFLEVAYETLEDAGYYPESLIRERSREVGVFVGAVWSMYQLLGLEERIGGNLVNPSSFFWSIANRVSHWMNFSGPSLTVDTACSASLTALHLACEAIRRGECFAALVGGVNLDLHRAKFDLNSAGGSFSRDGVCRSFGKGANGYVSGEGVGAVLLKRLDQAIADGDNIHGVIKSVAVTHSGRTSGYTVPGPQSQSKLILKALQRADIDARSIGYIEAHGTGTDLGDSIEIAGLTRAYQEHGVAKQSCPIGSVKTNIGHLEAASGIVGMQKVLLQMKHRTLVPSLHSVELNEGIDFAGSQFYVQQRVEEWAPRELDGVRLPRRAGLSAIGAGGTNAHVVLEEYKHAPRIDQLNGRGDRIFPLSAESGIQLREAAVRLHGFLSKRPGYDADDVAHTLQVGRKSFDFRLVVFASDLHDLANKLDAYLQGRHEDAVTSGCVKNAASVTGLLNATEKQEFIELLVRSGDPRRLSRLWCDGVIPEWRGLAIAQAGRKVSLPTYPFAGQRYWLTQQEAQPDMPVTPVDAEPVAKIRRTEKYHFSFGAESSPAGGLKLGLEDRVRLFVRHLIASQLRIGIEEIEDSRHLMETGITSLDMAEITQSIKLGVDEDFSPIVFFECTTIRSFAELLAQRYGSAFEKLTVTRSTVEEGETVVPLRRKAEPTQVPASSHIPLHVHDANADLALGDLKALMPAHPGKAQRLFLTGATGFLGIHVLAEFLGADPDVTAYCLVRAASKEQGLQRILKQAAKFELDIDESRITVVCGDIGEPKLGLSAEDWTLCAREGQQIVHASARVNHIEGYATFRDSTLGMKEIIRLASSDRLKMIQFVSSIAGCALKIGEEFSIYEKEDFVEAGAQVYGGYGQSKWVQEALLRRAAESGVPYVIYRFGELSGSARTGLGQTDDIVHRLLQMRLAVGCREKVSNDVLDMLPVDFAARLIVNTGNKPELWNAILHATHLKPYSFANMYRQAQHHGLQFAPVTRAAYLSRCYDFVRFIHSINPVNGFVLECVLRDAEGSVRSRKMMDAYFSVIFPFAQDNFRRSLQTLGLSLPEWGALIDSYFARWSREDCGFMARISEYRRWAQLESKAKAVSNSAAREELLLGKVNGA